MQATFPDLTPYCSPIDKINTLLPEAASFPDQSNYGRFSDQKSVLKEGRIYSSNFSGYYKKSPDCIDILFTDKTKESFTSNVKKIKFGFRICLNKGRLESVTEIFVKSYKSSACDIVKSLLISFQNHQKLFDENPEGLAIPPRLLEIRTRKQEKLTWYKVVYFETKYTTRITARLLTGDNLPSNCIMNRFEMVKGLREVALALKRCHAKKWVHLDVKGPNILLNSQNRPHMHLFDFDLMWNIHSISYHDRFYVDYEKKELKDPSKPPYFVWDMIHNQNGFVTPFCDLYGWAITLGILFWRSWFYEHAQQRIPFWNGAFENRMADEFKSTEGIILRNLSEGSPNVRFHHKAFHFVRRIVTTDYQRGRLFQSKEMADKLGTPEGEKLLSPYELGMDEAIALCDSLLAISNVTV